MNVETSADGTVVAEASRPSAARPPDDAPAGLSALLAAIRTAAPEAFLVPPRILRRVMRHEHGTSRLPEPTSARSFCRIDSLQASRLLSPDELGLPPDAPWPKRLLLMPQPEEEDLQAIPAAELLDGYWRRIFRARVHETLTAAHRRGSLSEPRLRRHVDRIGQPQFDEIRSVLHAENLLPDRRDLPTAYIEFVTLYAELRYFSPSSLPHFFPSLGPAPRIDAILAEDVELPALLTSSRPTGAAALPEVVPGADESIEEGLPPEADDMAVSAASGGKEGRLRRWLVAWADQASARGNAVRAATCRLRAARLASPPSTPSEGATAVRELETLAQRLAAPLELDAEAVSAWSRALPELLPGAARGIWSTEARLLYDLQKIAVEHGREVYAVDLVPWFLTFGRVPVKRPLPDYSVVLRVKHLRSARGRLSRCHLDEAARDRLGHLIQHATERAEGQLRARFGPRIVATLERMGWIPRNLPERLAREKLVQELLDRIIEYGHLTMGNLRDAVSRSDLKLPDLTGPGEFWRGDRLLRTDEAFRTALDGVYRPGEVYLRLLQRASSLVFGTTVGRAVTRFALLPFGGAFLTLEGVSHLINPALHYLGRHPVHVFNPVSFVVLGVFLLGLINHAGFRSRVARLVHRAGTTIRWLATTPVHWLLDLPIVRRILRSRAFDVLFRWGVKPLIFGLGALAGLLASSTPVRAVLGGGLVYLASAVLLNTRRGRDVEEIFFDRADRAWQRLRFNLVPGLFRWITETFSRVLETVERILYALDEWRRFHSGHRRPTILFKALLGLLVFFVAYVVRFGVVLVIEPQVNPIKHFPVVTVSHKVLAPLILALPKVLTSSFGVGKWTANIAAGLFQFILPGIFGFLVWELKENWKLFEANRRHGLEPVIVGHHGETIARLIRPGFHSGTLPRLYARARRAERKPSRPGRRSPARKVRDKIRGVERDVRHFIEREFLPLLDESRCLGELRFQVGSIALGTNRITVDVVEPRNRGNPLTLAFEEQSGWLVAGIVAPGWLNTLDDPARGAVRDALTGLYKWSGVDLVRQQIESVLPRPGTPYDITDLGLILWTEGSYRHEVLYPLVRGPGFPPTTIVPLTPESLKPLDAKFLLLSRHVLTWTHWVGIWERDGAGLGHPSPAMPGMVLLPRASGSEGPRITPS